MFVAGGFRSSFFLKVVCLVCVCSSPYENVHRRTEVFVVGGFRSSCYLEVFCIFVVYFHRHTELFVAVRKCSSPDSNVRVMFVAGRECSCRKVMFVEGGESSSPEGFDLQVLSQCPGLL